MWGICGGVFIGVVFHIVRCIPKAGQETIMNIPEKNLNPPPDDHEICPDCAGLHIVNGAWCRRCGGNGVVSKAEERRELEAVIGDREYDEMRDRKMMEEDEK